MENVFGRCPISLVSYGELNFRIFPSTNPDTDGAEYPRRSWISTMSANDEICCEDALLRLDGTIGINIILIKLKKSADTQQTTNIRGIIVTIIRQIHERHTHCI